MKAGFDQRTECDASIRGRSKMFFGGTYQDMLIFERRHVGRRRLVALSEMAVSLNGAQVAADVQR